MSRPVRALWIEILKPSISAISSMSRPVRALWIEIYPDCCLDVVGDVEAREGLVD